MKFRKKDVPKTFSETKILKLHIISRYRLFNESKGLFLYLLEKDKTMTLEFFIENMDSIIAGSKQYVNNVYSVEE